MLSSAECSTWYAVSLTIFVAVVAVNLLSIILYIKNSNLRTRAMYLVINLTVADMFVGGSATFYVVFRFPLYGCEVKNVFLIWPELPPIFTVTGLWFPLTSVTGIVAISLDRMHATFRPFRHRNIKKWAYGVTIAGVWILTAMILIPLPLISLYGNLHEQWQLLFPFVLQVIILLPLPFCYLCFLQLRCFKILVWNPSSVPWCGQQTKKTDCHIIHNDHCIFAAVVTICCVYFSSPFWSRY